MSQLTEPLKIELIGNAIAVEPFMPDTRHEKKMKEMGQMPIDAPSPKNKIWEDEQQRHKIGDFDEHPFQGIVKAISPEAKENIGSIKVNDRIAFRVGSGEPIVYQDSTYWRVAPHEILFKYLGNKR